MYKLFFTEEALEDMNDLDRTVAKRILGKLHFIIEQKQPLYYAKKLVNHKLGDYRFRVGDYRVIFDVESRIKVVILNILRIKHRKNAYE